MRTRLILAVLMLSATLAHSAVVMNSGGKGGACIKSGGKGGVSIGFKLLGPLGCGSPATAASFTSVATAGPATDTQVTVNRPAGANTISGVVVAGLFMENNSNPNPVVPSGWTPITQSTGTNTGPNPDIWLFLYWRTVTPGSEPSTYQWTFASSYSGAFVLFLSSANANAGCSTIEAGGSWLASTAGNDSAPHNAGITTAYNHSLLVWAANNFSEHSLTACPSGMTERADFSEIAVCTGEQVSLGASGTLTGDYSPNGNWNSAGVFGVIGQ